MAQQVITRNYPFSDGTLKQTADGLVATIARDLADLTVRKVTAASNTNLINLITAFDEHSTDEELLGLVEAATNNKLAKRTQAEKIIRSIRNMADIVYDGKGKYKSFGFEELTEMSDDNFYRLAKRVVRIGTKFLADLAPQGLDATILNNLKLLAKEFDDAIDAIEDAVENRDIETQERIKKGNALWKEMGILASVGKSVYEDVNEAKFNDYVLTPSASGSGSTPETPNS